MSIHEKLVRVFNQGQISRREFLARMSAIGASAVLSSVLLNTPAHAMTPKAGGRLKIGLSGGSTTDTLDPAIFTNIMPFVISYQVRNCLIEIDHKSQLVPELAVSWEPTPDAAQWTFKLRKGVEFHNGKTMDADDVAFSINHHRAENSKSPIKGLLSLIKEVKTDGKHTIVIVLDEGYANMPYIMSDYRLVVVPKGTADFDKGIGTGGYILDNLEPGVRAFAKRNPNYWKPGRAHFDEVETTGIEDTVARTNALRTGNIHVMNRCDRKTSHLLARSPGVQVIETTGTKHYTIPMRTDQAPFDDNDARLAMKYAIDRDQLLKAILSGHGQLGNDHPISPSNRFYASELPQRKYDPEKAKFHLKKAGLLDHTFKLHTAEAAYSGAIDTAVLYKEHAAKAGIKIEVVREPDDGYWSEVWMKKNWCFSYWLGRPTVDWTFSTAYTADAKWNESFWKHEKFNKLYKEARTELDETKLREIYTEMQRICRDEGGAVIPLFANDIMAASSKLKFEGVASNIELDGGRLTERWWFEA